MQVNGSTRVFAAADGLENYGAREIENCGFFLTVFLFDANGLEWMASDAEESEQRF